MFIIKVVSKKPPQEKSNHKVVVEIRMSRYAESNSITLGNHNLKLFSTAELTGKHVKYYVRSDMTSTQQECTKCSPANAFKIMMDTSRTASKNSGQLPLIANVLNGQRK